MSTSPTRKAPLNRARLARILVCTSALLTAPTAYAELLAYDGFDYPADTPLEFKNGGTGWDASGWTWRNTFDGKGGIILNAAYVEAGSLSYGGLQTEGNHLHLYGDLGSIEMGRKLANVIPGTAGTTTYISFIGQRVGAAADPSDPVYDNPDTEEVETYPYGENLYPRGASVRFFNASNGEIFQLGNYSNQSTNEWSVFAAGARNSGVSFSEAPAFVVMKIQHNGDETVADDIIMWINPDLTQPEDVSAAQVVNLSATDINDPEVAVDLSNISWISPWAGGGDSNRPWAEMLLDELRIGTTWQSVTPTGDGPVEQTWAGFPVDESGNCDTGDFLGYINVSEAPKVYSYACKTYLYMDESYVGPGGAWAYVYNTSNDAPTGGELTWAGYTVLETYDVETRNFLDWINILQAPYVFSYNIGFWFYMPESYVSASGSWGYFFDRN
jgi:hypothetical protein